MGSGALAILILHNQLAIFSGAILIAVGSIELLRRTRLQREAEAAESRLNTRLRNDLEGPSTQSLIQLSWRRSFECGHPVIDTQHRGLFDIGDGLIKAAVNNTSRAHIEFLLDELTEHIQAHFVTEEAVMARTRFPLSGEHRAHHDALLAKARSLRDRYHANDLELSELVGFIAYEVIANHILKEDLKFALKDRAVAAA
jgi:hemerythrin-like metal-binding protein